MAITLETIARNAAANGVVDLLNGGTVELLTSGDAVLATFTLGSPAFGDAATGVATANAIASVTAGATGSAAKFTVKASGGGAVFGGTVTATGGGGDMVMPSVSITSGETVELSALTFTMPAA